ncbi:shikimate dehydrogenase [Candidatus Gracilibacteria bacterium]|nr:shikimate dehydrogenase [Candidatus Gracilibacteria bacterium]
MSVEKKLYCVIGQPIAHSASPRLHNGWFRKLAIKARYEAVEVAPEDLRVFMKTFREKYAGGNVTIPHKEKVMKYLDVISDEAKKIGAVNTIVNKKGKLFGHNTDMYGALSSLKNGGVRSLKNKRVLVVGAGGAARAIVYGLSTAQAHVVIANRTLSKAKKLAREFDVQAINLAEWQYEKVDIIINATSVGLKDKNTTPLSNLKSVLKNTQKKPIVMDIVYNPKMTKLLKDARSAGCAIITGDHMFIGQAKKAFELWTGKKI